jgi:hypothetical protein
VLAGVKRGERYFLVRGWRRPDEDGVHVRAGSNLAIVRGDSWYAEISRHPLSACSTPIGDYGHLDIGQLLKARQHAVCGERARADDADPDFLCHLSDAPWPRMARVEPDHLWLLGRWDVQVHDDRLLAAAGNHAGERLVVSRVHLLVRNIGRNEDEVTWPRLRRELEALSPPHPGPTAQHVDHALDRAVMMWAGFGVRLNRYRAGPDRAGASRRLRDRGGPIHAGRLGRVRIKLIGMNDADPVRAPFRLGLTHPRLPSAAQVQAYRIGARST